ncbi:MAG: acylneuraminate cytidylyltransferase family protein [Halobacteriovoraceae bacterium]|nr:acylneuraminate cytidylyltransferase family protein [Halobacteriovoraceae bacterium]
MTEKKEVLAIIPARGGSKGIKNKNLYPLCGQPLIQYTLDAAKKSKLITRTILSTDDEQIRKFCLERGIEIPFMRPVELADDLTPMIDVLLYTVEKLAENENYKPDYILLLQPTSPLRTSEHIDEALTKLLNSDADSVVSVEGVPHRFSPESVMVEEGEYLKPYLPIEEKKNLRQLKKGYFARNGAAIYAFSYHTLVEKNSIYGEKILSLKMDRKSSIDIDDILDIEIAEFFLSQKNKN